MDLEQLQPGQRVRIIQTIDRREGDWTTAVEGIVREIQLEPTVSWFARGKDGRVWLRRVYVQKPDGEVSVVNIDQYSRIELLSSAGAAPASAASAAPVSDGAT